ncbi:MAG: hypothetical protein VX278_04965 [Myxococcota bacterium]|nr:hypothetical protein [Myxococcota bacterium]
MSDKNRYKKYFKWISILLLLLIVGLFLLQNSQRMTMIDSNGDYLSLDLFFYGIALKEPMGVSWLLSIAFVLGILFTGIVQFILKNR